MAEVTLRDYVKGVDQLIDREKLDEAIAHCRYILESHPKHLDTYRLLGKAYLEAKRYGDSADIFQRVLSAVPDDFVAHIGMAIVREDEGNLDSAIWHMERAFETNPANPAIQQELKRLIGRRDGLEPHKVRLTRGALARMYAHGDLYPQAIAELRSALQEDPDRPDLQVLLAEMYWRTEQKPEAAEVCNQVLQKLPYCREANRILAAILHASGKVDEAAAYHRRLAALDPYAAYVENVTIDPSKVDAASLKLERLEWQAGRPLPATVEAAPSDWASTLGLGAGEAGAALGETPSWLESAGEMPTSEQAPPVPEPVVETAQPIAAPEPPSEDIPEWMAEAGWKGATGEAVEGPVSFSDSELSSLESGIPVAQAPEEGELAPAEIPAWLQDKAPPPEELLRAEQSAESPVFEARPGSDWMNELAEDARTIKPEPEAGAAKIDRKGGELGGFEKRELGLEFARGADEELQTSPAIGASDESPAIPTWLEEVTPGATSTIVTWLGDRAKEGPKSTSQEGMPSWMKQAPASAYEAGEEQPAGEGDESPSWLQDVGATSEAMFGEESPQEAPGGPGSAAPAWLFGVAEAAALETSPDLDEMSGLRQGDETEPEAPVVQEEPGSPSLPAAPDWLTAIASAEQQPAVEEVTPDDASTEWLSGLAGEAVGTSADTGGVGAPDWLDGLGAQTPAAEGAAGGEMAWLEGLGQTGGAPPSEVPNWLDGLGAPPAEAPAAEEEPLPSFEESFLAEPEAPAASSADKMPGWLEEFGSGALAEEAELPVSGAPGVDDRAGGVSDLDWLPEPTIGAEAEEAGFEAAFPVDKTAAAPQSGSPGGPVDDDEVFRWLEDLASKQGMEPEPAIASSVGYEGPADAGRPPRRSDAELPEEPGEGLEWLERLATERGLPPEEEMVPAEPEGLSEIVEEAPGWMLDTSVERGTVASLGPGEPAEEDEMLGWLHDMTPEQPQELEEAVSPAAREDDMLAPDWLVSMSGEEELTARMEEPEPAEEEGLSWLGDMAVDSGRVTELPSDAFPSADELEWSDFERPGVPEDGGVTGFMMAEIEEELDMSPPADLPDPSRMIEEPDEEEVLEWLTRMSAESNEALQEAEPEAESDEAPSWLSQAEAPAPSQVSIPPGEVPSPTPASVPPTIERVEPSAPPVPPAAPPGAPEWLRMPAEDIPAPRAEVPKQEWPSLVPTDSRLTTEPALSEIAGIAAEPGGPPVVPAALQPETPPPPPIPAAQVPLPPAAPPLTPPAAVPPTPAAPPPLPIAQMPPAPQVSVPQPATEAPPAPPVPVTSPVAAPPAAAAPMAQPAAEVPQAPPAPVAPLVIEVPPTPPAPVALPAAQISPSPPAPLPQPVTVAPSAAAPAPPAPAAQVPAAPPPQAVPAPASPAKPKPGARDPGLLLEAARTALAGGDVSQAVTTYSALIKRRAQLPNIIEDLRTAVELNPSAANLWQALGDAYMKNDQVNDAIEAYRRGMGVA